MKESGEKQKVLFRERLGGGFEEKNESEFEKYLVASETLVVDERNMIFIEK